MHARLRPDDPDAARLFDLLEHARCEGGAARAYPGLVDNLTAHHLERLARADLLGAHLASLIPLAEGLRMVLRDSFVGRPEPSVQTAGFRMWDGWLRARFAPLIDTLAAVPAEARDHNHCADIQISPDGHFLYGSNRGHDSIAVVAVDQGTGKLSLVEFTPCGGPTPRNLGISPSGRLLFSANQNGDNVTIFRRDADTGKLTQAGSIPIGTPMCVRIVN